MSNWKRDENGFFTKVVVVGGGGGKESPKCKWLAVVRMRDSFLEFFFKFIFPMHLGHASSRLNRQILLFPLLTPFVVINSATSQLGR